MLRLSRAVTRSVTPGPGECWIGVNFVLGVIFVLFRNFRNEQIWRHLVEKLFNEDESFRKLCLLNDWWRFLPSQGGLEVEAEQSCKKIMYKMTNFHSKWSNTNIQSTKLFAGGLFSCLKLDQSWLFAGMLDGLIKMWDLSDGPAKPMRVFEGHEEGITCLDTGPGVLVSGSLDRSVRVWSLDSTRLLRVLRREGSPIISIKLLSDRLLWWARSGTFQISSWKGYHRVDPAFKFNIMEDPNSCIMCIGDHYIVTNQTDENGFSSRDINVYSSITGMRLIEKDIFSSKDISCLCLLGHLLFIGAGDCIEVWDVNMSNCLSYIQSGSPNQNISIKNICVSDFLMVALLSNSMIICVPIKRIIEESVISNNEPAVINWDNSGDIIENNDRLWKNMSIVDDKFVFGLEKKLGDIKLYQWKDSKPSRKQQPPLLSQKCESRDYFCSNFVIDSAGCFEEQVDLK